MTGDERCADLILYAMELRAEAAQLEAFLPAVARDLRGYARLVELVEAHGCAERRRAVSS